MAGDKTTASDPTTGKCAQPIILLSQNSRNFPEQLLKSFGRAVRLGIRYIGVNGSLGTIGYRGEGYHAKRRTASAANHRRTRISRAGPQKLVGSSVAKAFARRATRRHRKQGCDSRKSNKNTDFRLVFGNIHKKLYVCCPGILVCRFCRLLTTTEFSLLTMHSR